MWLSILATATLTWTAPTLNDDGSDYTDPSHYTVYAGCQQSGQYEEQTITDIPWTQTEITVSALPESTCYFVATATNLSGVASQYSGEATKTFDAQLPGTITNLDITWQESKQVMSFTFVEGAENDDGGSGGNASITFASAPTDGDLVVVAIQINSFGDNITDATGSGATFTKTYDDRTNPEDSRTYALLW